MKSHRQHSSSRLMEGFAEVEDEDCEIVAQQMQKLSSDAIYEILIRASFSTLLRQFRWVCKDWNKLITCDSKFQQTHSERTIASGHFLQVKSSTGRYSVIFVRSNNDHGEHYNSVLEVESPSLDFLPVAKSITIAGSSLHGSLLCCSTESSSTPIPSFYICKPASREWRKIPNPKTTFKSSRIGIAVKQPSCSRLHYKILRSVSRTGYGYHCQLFNSDTWAWKILPFVQFIKPDRTSLMGRDGIWVNGGLHWLTLYDEIFVFYPDQEKWATFEASPEMKDKMKNYSRSNRVAVSLLENHSISEPSWKRKYSIDTRSLQQNVEHVYHAHHMWSNNTFMMMSKHELVAFNCDKSNCTRAKLPMRADIVGLAPYSFQPQFCYL
ncbi:hypothetical protein MKX03_014804 [Papaver bracteatum]|nr:hypothetical protein MKX03_014804 [Papaver bracteatum]